MKSERIPSLVGSGPLPPILFVHGAYHAAWCWEKYFLPYFSMRGLDAYALNLRGHGGSASHEVNDQLGLEDYVTDVSHACKRFNIPPILVGHSVGAIIVQKYVQSNASSGIVMLAPTPLEPIPLAELRWAIRFPIRTALALASGDMNYLLPTFRKLFFSPKMPKDQVDHYMALMVREPRRVFRDISKIKCANPARVSVPALVLAAKQDRIPDGINQRLAEAFSATIVTLPVAHDMMLDPGWQMVADSIIEWVISLRDSTPLLGPRLRGSEWQP